MKYNFKIKTADEYLAGTDSNIFLVLEGETGESEEKRLNGYISGNAFERDDLDSFSVDFDVDVGRVFRIKLRSDMMYASAGWRVSYIEVQRDDGTKKDGKDENLSDLKSRFDINEWIEDKKTRTYTIPYSEWGKNIISYETVVCEYKKYEVSVPPNGSFYYEHTEKTTTGFQYTNAITKTSTTEFNEKIGGSSSYAENKKAAQDLKTAKNFAGYLEFAFKQGFSESEINEIVQKEDKEISVTQKGELKNPDNYQKHYNAVFNLVKVNAVTSTGGIVAMFSANSEIVFAGFKEIEK